MVAAVEELSGVIPFALSLRLASLSRAATHVSDRRISVCRMLASRRAAASAGSDSIKGSFDKLIDQRPERVEAGELMEKIPVDVRA